MLIRKCAWLNVFSIPSLALVGAGAFGQAAMAAALEGSINVDGSSTVYPITEAVAEEFLKEQPKVRVKVGMSGTGGGFKKFCAGETAISNASRPIKEGEIKSCLENKIEFIELPVAYDGITVVINQKNTWAQQLTKEQLKKMWEPDSKVKTWKDVNPAWPANPIKLYGPGPDSGTFDYFTEDVVGKAKASRSDFTASEDDNVLVTGVAGDQNALGYFGYAYFVENQKKLKEVPLDFGKGAIASNDQTIENGTYPLSRPLFIYVNKKNLERPEVDSFVKYYLKSAKDLAKQVGYVALPKKLQDDVQKRFDARKTGTGSMSASH